MGDVITLLPEMPSQEELFPELKDAEVRETIAAFPDYQKRLDALLTRYEHRFRLRQKRLLDEVKQSQSGKGRKPGKGWQKRFVEEWCKDQRQQLEHLINLSRTAKRSAAFVARVESEYGCKVAAGKDAQELLPHTNLKYLRQKGHLRGAFFERRIWFYAVDDLNRLRTELASGIEKRRLAAEARELAWRQPYGW